MESRDVDHTHHNHTRFTRFHYVEYLNRNLLDNSYYFRTAN